MTHDCGEIVIALRGLEQDFEVPRSVKLKITQAIGVLENGDPLRIKLNRALHDLESLGEDNNLQPMTRTALLSVLSLIESKANH